MPETRDWLREFCKRHRRPYSERFARMIAKQTVALRAEIALWPRAVARRRPEERT